MNTLLSLKLNNVEIEDSEVEILACEFGINNDRLNNDNPYDVFLKIIAEKVEVIEYDKKSNTAVLDLSGFVDKNFCVLDEMLDIPCCDPEAEYLDVIVAMINGYGSKPYYKALYDAYMENKFVDSWDNELSNGAEL